MKDVTEIKFRASSTGYLMVTPRSKSETISETTKTHLIDVFTSWNYGRREDIANKFLDKGNARQDDATTLVSRINKRFFKQNTIRLTNEFITGEPDLFIGESVDKAEEVLDTKCSWSANTFFRSKFGKDNEMYYWQLVSYMALTGAKKATLCYCLINGTDTAINDEKRKLQWKLGVLDVNNPTPEYLAKAQQIEKNMIYDMASFTKEYPHFNLDTDLSTWESDIPMEERIYSVSFERDESDIAKIYERVMLCRSWINDNLMK